MSLDELIAELPALSFADRQELVRHAIELDNAELSSGDELIIDKRLEEHRQNPESALSLQEMNSRLRSRFGE